MIIDGKKFASMCDIGTMAVTSTMADAANTCKVAIEHKCCSVFGLKCYASYMKSLIKDHGINLEFSICNNPGSDDTQVKVAGALRYVEMGLDEVEMYINMSYLKSGMDKEAIEDIAAVRKAIGKDKVLKVIIQTPLLDDSELARACEIVIAGGGEGKNTFVKTGNGEFGATTRHAVEVISKVVNGRSNIKATAPFASIDDAYYYIDLGVTRFGITVDEFLRLEKQADARYAAEHK